MTINKINEMVKNGSLTELHTSWMRGYISRKGGGMVENYQGRFGKGFAVYTPSWKSTQYHYVTYYLYN